MWTDIESYIKERTTKSREAFDRAKKWIPGGVVSPARLCVPYPIYMDHGEGAEVVDIDGNKYIDCRLGLGPILLGHCRDDIKKAAVEVLDQGFQFGSNNRLEEVLAQKMIEIVPCAEKVVFCSSGTESTMHSYRIARAFTGKNAVAKFEGGYHGGHDYALANINYDPDMSGDADSPQLLPEGTGIPLETLLNTIILPYNNPAAFNIIERESHRLAAVILEVVQGNVGSIPVEKPFLQRLREITMEKDIVLIFDEVITGFRLAPGGGQAYYGVTPDLATFGKAIGGGFPIGVIAGRDDIMSMIEILEDKAKYRKEKCFYAGTYNGNSMSMTAGNVVIDYIRTNPQFYNNINAWGKRIRSEIEAFAADNSIDLVMTGTGSIFSAHFVKPPVRSVRDLAVENKAAFWKLYLYLLKHGVFTHPSHGFLSAGHTFKHIDMIIDAFTKSLLEMKGQGLI